MFRTIKLKKIIISTIIFFIIFIIFYYKNFIFGNNIIKNRSNEKAILNEFKNYNAEIEVKITNNKTENLHKIYQEVNNNSSMQEIIEGEDIEGVRIELKQNNLKISNTKLGLEKNYKNYEGILNNSIFLNSFVNDYLNKKNSTNYFEENEQIIMEVKLNNTKNTYIKYKKLYIDKKTLKPIKMKIEDYTKKETISIIYNNVELIK
jgi:hypothetical protein